MASAVLASRTEPQWGEREVYMRKYTSDANDNSSHLNRFNPNPSFISNPTLGRQIRDSSTKSHLWQSNESLRTSPPPRAYDESPSRYRRPVSFKDRNDVSCVSIDLSAYSRRELKQLKRRLISELEQVRSLRNQIEDRDVESRRHHASSNGYSEAREVQRPPPLELNKTLDSPVDVTRGSDEKRATHINHEQRNSKIAPGKNKKVLGQKRGLPFISGKVSKRPVTGDPQVDKLMSSTMKKCAQILVKLMKHKHGWVFNTPVDTVTLGLHDYHLIIKHPMDLGTVKAKLDKNQYGSPLDFASDVRLTFNNAMTYNPKGQDVHLMAETLLMMFEQMFNPDYQRYEAEHRRIISTKQVRPEIWSPPAPAPFIPTPRALPEPRMIANKSDSSPPVQSTLSNAPPVQPPESPATKTVVSQKSTVKLPKPKAKDPNKRPMSFEEKAKLGVNLQNLPPEKMDQLVQIIKKRNSHLAQEGDEIELDIEAIDTETLWELDRFVSYHKKAVSKMKRQGLSTSNPISTSISTSLIDQSAIDQQSEPTLDCTPKNKRGDAGEEDVDIGEEIPVASFPPVEIEKDSAYASNRSSSSSSSSSGSDSSSSSDSGSGSSSGSDSEEDSVQSPFVEQKEEPVLENH